MGGPAVTDAFVTLVPTESPRALPDGSQQAGDLGTAQHLPLTQLPTGGSELQEKGTTTTRGLLPSSCVGEASSSSSTSLPCGTDSEH